jgi:predicted nuclease of predicted toxin-antitoxin system
MKILVDNALSPDVARGLSAAGHDALYVQDIGLGPAVDSVIFDREAAEDSSSIVESLRARQPSATICKR